MFHSKTLLNSLLIVVMLLGMVGQPAAMGAAPAPAPRLAAGLSDAGFGIIADFEGGLPAGFIAYTDSEQGSGSSTTIALDVATIAIPLAPSTAENKAVKATYDIAASGGWGGGPGYGGLTHDLPASLDLSDYSTFTFLYYGANSGKSIGVELKTDGNSAPVSNRYVANFTDDFAGWKLVMLPFSSFTQRYDYNPGPTPDDPLNLMKFWGYSVMLPSAASGVIYLDWVGATTGLGIADFDAGVPAGFVPFADAWDGTGSSTTLNMDHVTVTDLPVVPPVADNKAIAVTYNIAASGSWGGGPGYGGITHNFAPQDWSDYESFSLWYQGSNNGADIRIELKSTGAGEDTNRFVYTFTDNSTGWRLINVPWSAFVSRGDYNPGPDPNAPIDLTVMQGYSILLPGGAQGSFKLDHVSLFGKPASGLAKIGFSSATYSVVEGETATVTVQLSQAAAEVVEVNYATAHGTASAQDYTAASGTLTFQPGDLEKTFAVVTLQDKEAELNETVLLSLASPVGGILGAQKTATLTIVDDDVVVGDPFIDLLEDFENELPFFTGSDGNALGFITWGSANNTTLSNPEITDETSPLVVPGVDLPNHLLKVDFDIASGGWGGFTQAFITDNAWGSQDWYKYTGISFWMYGNNTGGEVNLDIFDNKTTNGDSAERYTYIFKDDFSGWKFFRIPWNAFSRKGWQPGGAPNDGLTLTEVWGYAFGFPANVGAQTMYIDNMGLMIRHDIVEDFESGISQGGQDEYGNPLGFVTWGSGAQPSLAIQNVTEESDPLFVPYLGAPNNLLKVDYNINAGGWGGFSHNFEAEGAWVSQNWKKYEGVSFWIYGNNTGGEVAFDIFDNKTTTGDSAERFTYIFKDDFSGWKFFMVPFESFIRKGFQPGGAPDDGLTLTQVWGYAFGFPAGVGARSVYLDQLEVYGSTERPIIPLTVGFEKMAYSVLEGRTVTVGVKLSVAAEETVTVEYAARAGSATAGRDFTATSGTLSFAAGETLKTFEVVTLPDSTYEGDETVVLSLSSPTVAELGNIRRVDLVILDDDPFNARLIDNFELATAAYRYTADGPAQRELFDISAGDPLARPGQDPVNTVLKVTVEGNLPPQSPSPAGIIRTFAESVDWSREDGLRFWYYGTNSGQDVTVSLHENRAADPGPEGWVKVWGDDFSGEAGTKPDPNRWGYDLGGWGWGNAEQQFYTDEAENASMDGDGNLAIVAKPVEDPAGMECWYGDCLYTSARLLSKGRFDFAYGRAEARLKLPYGQGIWPAFWMLGNDLDTVGWPTSGEIDIMEHIGKEPTKVYGTVHGPGYSGGGGVSGSYELESGTFSDDFHTFAVEWEPEVIRWYMDGNHFFTVTPEDLPVGTRWVFDHPHFLILNLAVGGHWPGYPDDSTVFPQTLLVDYVHVYQAADTAERFEYTFADDFSGWKLVDAPFAAFERAAVQPEGAPNDGLTLNEVWGFGIHFEQAAEAVVYYLDDIELYGPYYIWLPIIQR